MPRTPRRPTGETITRAMPKDRMRRLLGGLSWRIDGVTISSFDVDGRGSVSSGSIKVTVDASLPSERRAVLVFDAISDARGVPSAMSVRRPGESISAEPGSSPPDDVATVIAEAEALLSRAVRIGSQNLDGDDARHALMQLVDDVLDPFNRHMERLGIDRARLRPGRTGPVSSAKNQIQLVGVAMARRLREAKAG